MPHPTLRQKATRFGEAVLARSLLVEVAGVLERSDVEIMPLKGVLLHALVYDDAMDRRLTDVDIAVRSVDFERAFDALLGAGFVTVREEPGRYEVALLGPAVPLCVDLHRSFSATRRFRLDPDAMFARGRVDRGLFGCALVLPDDLDLYAHLLAHTTLDYVGGTGWSHPGDLARVAVARRLDPALCALRLDEHGLGRLARVGLARGTPLGTDPFAADVLASLAADRVGDVVARAIGSLEGTGVRSALRRALAVLLNPTLQEAGAALAERAKRARVRK